MREVEGVPYPEFPEVLYEEVIRIMKEAGKPTSRGERRKIRSHHELPPEFVFSLFLVEEKGYEIGTAPIRVLIEVFKTVLSRIDRTDKYDQALIEKIGWMETMRWRLGAQLKEDGSLEEIVSVLREHAVPRHPRIQYHRAKFAPVGEYRHEQGL
ncbi:MAG: hypothetical protein PHS53_01445 [Candidatus Pacebacteria bacterium]|nr:hypothetical protein [Candidatus Paceibacterota bacterium]MDD5356796.1 hypothetical protein [Candidatus Paceibacterota bacterium]